MSLLDLYSGRIDQSIQRDLARPPVADEPQSFNAWSFMAAGAKGVPRGGLQGAGSVSDLLSGFGTALAATNPSGEGMFSTGTDSEKAQAGQASARLAAGQAFDPAAGNALRRKANEFAPDPQSSSKADQVINGLATGVTKAATAITLMGPLPGAAAFGAGEANNTYRELIEKGVDEDTAMKVAGVTGVASGVGAAIPVGGATVAQTMGLVLASGPATFVAQEKLSHDILEKAGYKDEASLHNPTDPLGLALSTVIPFAFGAAHVAGIKSKAKAPEAIKTEADVKDAVQLNPAEQSASDAFERSATNIAELRMAIDAETRPEARAILEAELANQVGQAQKHARDVTVTRGAADPEVVDAARVQVTSEAFYRSLPSHETAYAEVMHAGDEISAGRMPRVDPLTEFQQIESRLTEKLANHEAAVAEYASRPDAEGGKVLNTDVARELSPDYLKDRTQSAAVHEPASAFVKRMYEEKLAAIKPGDQVMFTSGGTGAGKTSAIEGIGAVKAMKDDASIVYDTNMNTLGSAVKKIEQALDAGANVRIVHVQRDPVDALVHGALPRAKRQEAEFGTGRTVPLKEHARTHKGAAEVIQQLAEKYKDDQRVDIQVVDNTRGKGGQQVTDLGFVRSFDYTGIEGRLYEALRQQRDSGAISEAIFRGTEGASDTSVRSAVRGTDGSQPPRENGRAEPGGATEAVKREATSLDSGRVDRLVETNPNLKVRLPGSDEELTVAAALQRAKEEADYEISETGLVQAALDCVLG